MESSLAQQIADLIRTDGTDAAEAVMDAFVEATTIAGLMPAEAADHFEALAMYSTNWGRTMREESRR